jgi:hypothetical protein
MAFAIHVGPREHTGVYREELHSIGKCAIAIDVVWPIPEEWRKLSGHYVVVEAVFDSERKGHSTPFLDRSGAFD